MLRNQDERGLSILYDHYAPALLGQISNIVGDQSVAEEVLQQTMMKVWNSISGYDESKAGLFAWLSRIARNAAIDKVRLKSFQRNKKTEAVDLHVNRLKDRAVSTANIDVNRLIKNLDEKYKVVLDHVYLLGYSQSEAAEALDIPLGTVKTRLRGAIKILRTELKDEKSLFFSVFVLLLLLAILVL